MTVIGAALTSQKVCRSRKMQWFSCRMFRVMASMVSPVRMPASMSTESTPRDGLATCHTTAPISGTYRVTGGTMVHQATEDAYIRAVSPGWVAEF